jgi:small GTP-binding protein
MEKTPLIAIVGRPNVGKSTLFNHLVGSRRAIVGDEPGITRDRLYGEAHWRGHDLRVVDTGGIIPEDKEFIPSEIFRQARVAFTEAAAIVMVVDARTELAAPDLELARLLQRTGKPLFLAANKIDSQKQEGLADDLHRLGIAIYFQSPPNMGVELMICWMRCSTSFLEKKTHPQRAPFDFAQGRLRTQRNAVTGCPVIRVHCGVRDRWPTTNDQRPKTAAPQTTNNQPPRNSRLPKRKSPSSAIPTLANPRS